MILKKYSYNDISQFSKKDLQYINLDPKLNDFYNLKPDLESFEKAINAKSKQAIDRVLLTEVLKEQCDKFPDNEKSIKNIELLKKENSFTIITAHQPSLLTGPLYYIFKIASAINLCNTLNEKLKTYNFIPLFITGGEDHDFEEINHVKIFNDKITWDAADWNGGSVGRLKPETLEDTILKVVNLIGDKSHAGSWLLEHGIPLAKTSINYSEFARHLTHRLFSKFGLVILSMDDERLKEKFSSIIQLEVLEQKSQALVEKTQAELASSGWKSQAHAREINFFYLENDQRLRIIKDGEIYGLQGSPITWSASEMAKEIEKNPAKFSPNVVMRPLFQEFILPNLAYIGGGGEIAYWLERKRQFDSFEIPFPMLIRRNSALILNNHQTKNLKKSGQDLSYFFHPKDNLINIFLEAEVADEISLDNFREEIEPIVRKIVAQAKTADPTLEKFAEAELTKWEKSMSTIEGKIKKAYKVKQEIQINRILKTHEALFPDNGLQERKENIFPLINEYGWELIDFLVENLDPLDRQLSVISQSS